MPRLSGTAMISAMADVTSVPKMNVKMPNCPVLGSQFVPNTKYQPWLRKIGIAVAVVLTTMEPRMISTSEPQAAARSANRESALRPTPVRSRR